jgi:hypothetical protein
MVCFESVATVAYLRYVPPSLMRSGADDGDARIERVLCSVPVG